MPGDPPPPAPTGEAETACAAGEGMALAAFRRAARRVPAYREILREAGVDPEAVRTIADFRQKVPLLDKQRTFARFEVDQLCVDGSLDGVVGVITSSGHSGVFSYGVFARRDVELAAAATDRALGHLLRAHERKTLLINCLAMGVPVYTNLAAVATTSVREDVVIALVKKFARTFDQLVLAGEQAFLKKVVEDGRAAGIDWPSLLVHVGTGGEWVAENWRMYLASLLGIDLDDPATGLILCTMGAAELFQNVLFTETLETQRIRRLAHGDARLRRTLFGGGVEACPMCFVYDPRHLYLEVVPADAPPGELVFTLLDPDLRLPLPRYRTYDRGRVLDHGRVGSALREAGHGGMALPVAPLAAVYGRRTHLEVDGVPVYPEPVKEALYSDFELASAVTANFKMRRGPGGLEVHVQLAPGRGSEGRLAKRLEEGLARYLPVPARIRLYEYAAFPWGVRLDYERKFAYLGD